ncbi:2Fe-2S iron-sulfur cluster-binding protein [Streptomyces sp. NPDC127098]|uniref:2Fe-2S iron-sulfur cluster-binding protein n=1 Tax=Streptomyces sp. NPDC127098 TaxID=3347137 RepID=UPI0036541049
MRIFYEGRELPARPGQSVAAALIAAGIPAWRTTRHAGRPRGLFCGIGSCHDCLATIDDAPPQRTCVVPVRDGMRVSSTPVPELPGPAAPSPPPADGAAGLATARADAGTPERPSPASPSTSGEAAGPPAARSAADPRARGGEGPAAPPDDAGVASGSALAGGGAPRRAAGGGTPQAETPAGAGAPAGNAEAVADEPAGPQADTLKEHANAASGPPAAPACAEGAAPRMPAAGHRRGAGAGAAPLTSAPQALAGDRPVADRPPSAGVVVVGSGPAGLGVAVTAAERGVSVVLLDAGERPGGQYWRHAADDDVRGPFAGWWRRLRAQVAAGRIDYRPGQQVWLVTREDDGRFRVETTPVHDGVRPLPGPVEAAAVVLCPGGADRQLPVPGWTLPGVVAAGGAQALLKGHRTVAGRRVVVAGTGPFLLPVATGLARAGARVVGVWEANSPLRWARQARAVLPVPGKLAEAAGYAAALARHRVPYRPRTAVAEILGTDRVRAVRRAVVGRDGVPRPVPGEVEVDLVALGWGFTPALELPLQLGVATRLDVDGSLVVDVDRDQRTDVPGVLVAGEATGVGGATLSLAEGRLAGHVLAGAGPQEPGVRRLRATIRAHRAFAAAMHRAHPVPAGWHRWLTDDTLLCRCEEVPHAAVRAAHAELGAADARTVKMLTRLGMGWCQGRVCGFAAACLTAALDGRSPDEGDARATASRPLAVPVPLAELAGEAEDAAN